MKKSVIYLIMGFMSLTILPCELKAITETNSVAKVSIKESEAGKANTLISRLYEINAMDKSKLGIAEKNQLRQEVRGIKNQLKLLGGGVYLSVGAIIIIILLLILLL